ncbi:MAG: cell wall-binding protein, partial [Bacillota bacterium]|nr:cell wall-binding protein [Bacillota bacterium]
MKSFVRPLANLAGWTFGILIVFILMTGRAYGAECIYYTQSYAPYQLKMAERSDPSASSVIYTSPTGSPYAVAVDESEKRIYFSDPHSTVAKIFRAELDGSNVTAIIEGVHAQGLAVNQKNGDLYYAEPDTGTVYRAARGSSGGTIIYSSAGTPRAVALDTEGNGGAGYLYIADYNLGKIVRTELDGSNPQTFLDGVHASGLAVDGVNGKLYYAAAYEPDFFVERVNLTDGQGKETIYTSPTGSPRALAIDMKNGSVYFSDWHSTVAKIFRANLTGEIGLTELVSSANAYGVAVFAETPQTSQPSVSVLTNAGYIKKDASIAFSSETGAKTYYTTAVNGEPAAPTEATAAYVSSNEPIPLPSLTFGDVLTIKAASMADGKTLSELVTCRFTVQPKTALSATGVSIEDKEYDGNDVATGTISGNFSGVLGTDVVSVAGTPLFRFENSFVGEDKTVQMSGLSVAGVDWEYYTLNQTISTTAKITKKSLVLGSVTASDKEYDGTDSVRITELAIASGIIGSDEVSVDLDAVTAVFEAGAAAGENKDVAVSNILLKGSKAQNYSIASSAAATADILPKTVTVSGVIIFDKPYDGNAAATISSADLAGKVGTEEVYIDYSGASASFDDEKAGKDKPITVTGLKLGGSDKNNYQLLSNEFRTVGNITPLGTINAPEASIASGSFLKNGAKITLTAAGGPETVIYYTLSATATDPDRDDGSTPSGGTVTITGNLGGTIVLSAFGAKTGYTDSPISRFTYQIQGSQILSITGVSAADKDYDGTRDAAISGGTLSGVITPGDDVALDSSGVYGLFADKNAGTSKAVEIKGYELKGADAAYYSLQVPELTADIRERDVSISSVDIEDKIYDGTTLASILGATLSWKAAGDDVFVDLPLAVAAFDDAALGSGKQVAITGLVLAGSDEGNYYLINSDTQAYGNIIATGTVASPYAEPSEGNILSGAAITLSTSTDGAEIYYSTDGSTPSEGGNLYGGAIKLTGNAGVQITVKAIAVKAGMTDSGILEKTYTFIAAPKPDDDPPKPNHGSSGKEKTKTSQEPEIRIVNTQTDSSAVATLTASADAAGKSNAAVSMDDMNKAMIGAVKEAEQRGGAITAGITIHIDAPQSSSSVTTGIPTEAIRQAVAEGIRTLTVSTPIASVSFDSETLSGIAGETAGQVKITAAKADASKLSGETLQLVGSRPVYQLGVTEGDRAISHFNGTVTVSIPYTPQ